MSNLNGKNGKYEPLVNGNKKLQLEEVMAQIKQMRSQSRNMASNIKREETGKTCKSIRTKMS